MPLLTELGIHFSNGFYKYDTPDGVETRCVTCGDCASFQTSVGSRPPATAVQNRQALLERGEFERNVAIEKPSIPSICSGVSELVLGLDAAF